MAEPEVIIPPRKIDTDYPLIDTDPHITRVFRYARGRDYAEAGAWAAFPIVGLHVMEYFQPTYISKRDWWGPGRLCISAGLIMGCMSIFGNSCLRFYGWTENAREVEMDMREMVDKVKRGEPLYGHSTLSPYMQGVAARNSRYTALMSTIIVWPNVVHHPYHGVDTAKYYQQAERELAAEDEAKNGGSGGESRILDEVKAAGSAFKEKTVGESSS